MASQAEIWNHLGQKEFKNMSSNWHNRFLIDGIHKPPTNKTIDRLADSNWKQDVRGNWVLGLEEITILDRFKGVTLPYRICLPQDLWASRNSEIIRELFGFAIGLKRSQEFIGSGTRSSCGLVELQGAKIAILYMNEVDLDGVDRLSHTDLLCQNLSRPKYLCQVPSPIFATSNCYFSTYIEGRPVNNKDLVENCSKELISLKESLIDVGMWNQNYGIDLNPLNYIVTEEEVIYNLDPVLWHSSFIF